MATAFTDTVLNYSGLLYAGSDNSTRLLNAVYSRGKANGEGIVRTGVRKVNSTDFALSSSYSIAEGAQPAITEAASITAPEGTPVTRDQKDNCIQLFHESVAVSYLKQSAVGNMSGLNIAGQQSNVTNERDFQVAATMMKIAKDMNYTLINGVYQKGSTNTTAYKSRGLIAALDATKSEYTALDKNTLNAGILAAMEKGFMFDDGRVELWINPGNFAEFNDVYSSTSGYAQPATREEGGIAIKYILTDFGWVEINYDRMIPKDSFMLLNMNELAIAELDVPGKGNFFYEELAKNGAAERGQIYGQAGIDYGAAQKHILFKKNGG